MSKLSFWGRKKLGLPEHDFLKNKEVVAFLVNMTHDKARQILDVIPEKAVKILEAEIESKRIKESGEL